MRESGGFWMVIVIQSLDVYMLFRKPVFTFAMITLGLVLPTLSLAGSATISWNPNAEPDLSGYRIYYGTASRSYGPPIPVAKVTQYTLGNLTDGKTYYFAVTAIDLTANESGYSTEAQKAIPATTAPDRGRRGVREANSFYLLF
jgi:hypothetical protein